MAKDLTVVLENRPGTLADVGETLGKAGINLGILAPRIPSSSILSDLPPLLLTQLCSFFASFGL